MEDKKLESEEISLIDLLAVLFRYKWLIIGITGIAIVFVVALSIVSSRLPPEKSFWHSKYRTTASLFIDPRAFASKVNSDGFYVSKPVLEQGAKISDELLNLFVKEFHLNERYKIPEAQKDVLFSKLFGALNVKFNINTGVFTICFEDIDAEFAKDGADFCLKYFKDKLKNLIIDSDLIKKQNTENAVELCLGKINSLKNTIKRNYNNQIEKNSYADLERLKFELESQKDLYNRLNFELAILNIKIQSKNSPIKILEEVKVGSRHSSPSRKKIIILVSIVALFFSVFLAFLIDAIKKMKNDDEIIKKFKSAVNAVKEN